MANDVLPLSVIAALADTVFGVRGQFRIITTNDAARDHQLLHCSGRAVRFTCNDQLRSPYEFLDNIILPFVRSLPQRPWQDTNGAKPNLLDQRGQTHGDYRAMSTRIQQIKAIMRMGSKWVDMPEPQKEALELIATKIGRIIEGDPEFKDHWDDLSGYAAKASEFCRKGPSA